MFRNRQGKKKKAELRCETCNAPKRLDEMHLFASSVGDSAPGTGGSSGSRSVTREEVTQDHIRRAVWDRVLRGQFPDQEDRRHGYVLQCDKSHPISTVETVRICVIGLTETGKTHYLTALFHLLLDDQIPHLAMTPLSDGEMQRIRPQVRDVFDLHQVVPGTNWERRESVQPYSFSLRLDLPNGSRRTVAVEIYDFPGEFSDGAEKTNAFAPFVENADALIFFVSPLSIRGLSRGLLQSTARAGDAPGPMFARYANLWRQRRGFPIFGTDLVPSDTPIGVVLNRADVLCDHSDPEIAQLVTLALEEPAPTEVDGLSSRIDRHSHLTRALLTGAGEAGLVRRIEEDYPLARYFLASPLGGQPTKDALQNDAWRESTLTLGGVALPFLAVIHRLLDGTGAGR